MTFNASSITDLLGPMPRRQIARADGGARQWPGQSPAQVLARPLQSRAHGLNAQLAGRRNLLIAQTGGLSQQKDIPIEVLQRFECLSNRHAEFLHGRRRRVAEVDRCRLVPVVAPMVQGEVAGNAKHPGAAAGSVGVRRPGPRDPQEHLLRQVVGRFRPADHAAEIAEDAVSVLREEDVRFSHARRSAR
jgi:hypothetical protein